MSRDANRKLQQFAKISLEIIKAKPAVAEVDPEAAAALTDLLNLIANFAKAELTSHEYQATASKQKPDFDPRLIKDIIEALPPALPLLKNLSALSQNCSADSMHISPQETRLVKITFTNTSVIVNGKSIRKNAPFILMEYLILKRRPLHYLWAYVILPTFQAKDPDWQFRNYVSKIRKKFTNCGIHITTRKERSSDGKAEFQGIDDHVVSNVINIHRRYEQAVSKYEEGGKTEAIQTLLCITKDIENQWYTFTDAYMHLARWICELSFEGIPENTIESCREFLQWYFKRLRLGISKIEMYMQQNSVGSESLDELQSIKTEFDHVKKLRSAFIEQVPFAKDELEYDNLVSVMMNFREKLLAINEESEREVEKDSVAEVIKLLCEKNKALAEVVKYGRDVLDGLLEAKHQRQKCIVNEIQDMHINIYWLVGEIITEFENFDEFDQKKVNKLMCLKLRLCHRLRQELKKCI